MSGGVHRPARSGRAGGHGGIGTLACVYAGRCVAAAFAVGGRAARKPVARVPSGLFRLGGLLVPFRRVIVMRGWAGRGMRVRRRARMLRCRSLRERGRQSRGGGADTCRVDLRAMRGVFAVMGVPGGVVADMRVLRVVIAVLGVRTTRRRRGDGSGDGGEQADGGSRSLSLTGLARRGHGNGRRRIVGGAQRRLGARLDAAGRFRARDGGEMRAGGSVGLRSGRGRV